MKIWGKLLLFGILTIEKCGWDFMKIGSYHIHKQIDSKFFFENRCFVFGIFCRRYILSGDVKS